MESKYAAQLRAMGFVSVDSQLVYQFRLQFESQEVNLDTKTTPSFEAFDFVTYATDELGGRWTAEGRKDLTPLGFRDNVERFKAINEGLKC